MRSKKEKTLKQWLVPKLRKISSHWPNKNLALRNARVKVKVGEYKNGNDILKSMYRCAICGELYDSSEVAVDHKIPVVNLQGFKDWNSYIPDLFCDIDNLQVICHSDHEAKSFLESQIRKENKKLDK